MEPNATLVIAYVRQDVYFQIVQALGRNDVTDFQYTEITSQDGTTITGRFELVIPDSMDARRIVDGIKRYGTGYNPPDVKISSMRVHYETNAK